MKGELMLSAVLFTLATLLIVASVLCGFVAYYYIHKAMKQQSRNIREGEISNGSFEEKRYLLFRKIMLFSTGAAIVLLVISVLVA